MLPGFRAIAATIMLAVAVVTFGLGAAALLRAAHEDFATLPTWRPAMEAIADITERDMPVLAALRVEPEIVEPPARSPMPEPPALIDLPELPPVALKPPAPRAPIAVVAALPQAPQIELPAAPYNAPRLGPVLMPEIATNDAPPVALAALAPANADAEPDAEPLEFAPLPRPRPVVAVPALRPRIAKRTPQARRVASRPRPAAAQRTSNPFEQIFGSGN